MKKKIRVGMIGYGFMGKAHTNAFRQAAKFFPDLPYEPELKMFCARNEERAKQFADNWGYEKVVTDWRQVVESDEVDLIDICAPNNMHRDIAVAAAEAGKWVFFHQSLFDSRVFSFRQETTLFQEAHQVLRLLIEQ